MVHQTEKDMKVPKMFGELAIGTVVNYYCPVTDVDIDYVILNQYETREGTIVRVLQLSQYFIIEYKGTDTIDGIRWTIKQEN